MRCLAVGVTDQDLIAVCSTAKPHDVCDPVDQHGGLAAAGACQKQQGAIGGQHSFLLHVVQIVELGNDILPPCGQESGLISFVHRHTYPI